ncbi:kinesin-domain-containing protein [Exidia glandulosa HHB12029]|uniref:Kinesin-like protein n=1 Tax=Exidia glandulosa HHB12029 TaxID=1314781 RepID=A0A165F2S5_EXIGL|nr:kinesin-domain-containing protein [Exidia glandulosa HHB12029]
MAATKTRPPPFTPRRPRSLSATPDPENAPQHTSHPPPTAQRTIGQLRAPTPQQQVPRKITASVSVESRTRANLKVKTGPAAPPPRSKTPVAAARPRTPGTPKRSETPHTPRRGGTDSPAASPTKSGFIGLSGPGETPIDPEDGLVDCENVEVDLSQEIDPRDLDFSHGPDHGAEDKVLVSIRLRPTNGEVECWDVNRSQHTLKVQEQYARASGTSPPEFCFDEVLTGSDNKVVYNAAAKSHVRAAMDGFNSVIFAYGQTASGKTFTLSGSDDEPGIIPRAMKDVFGYIRRTPSREFLLRASYLEIYNEQIHDLLSTASLAQPVQLQGAGPNVIITPLREEVVTSLKGVREVIERGNGNRRTATTDWNERSSRSHSVFRLVIESRERTTAIETVMPTSVSGGNVPQTLGGPLLQAKNGRSVRTSVLSLIDLAGSEKATSDKDRTREGRYINTSLLTLGTVIGTLAENAAKGKNDHVPYRNSKLTRMLQPCLSGNARISVVCTLNPTPNAIPESTSTLLFAQRVKKVAINATKKEIVDTDALIERYRKEIEDLKRRLDEREKDAPVKNRRLSAREQVDESRAMHDLQSRIKQLTKLILTSQTVDENKNDGEESPTKLNFDLSTYELQQELLLARRELDIQANQILSLEAALSACPPLPADAPEDEKDKLIIEQTRTIRELEIVVRGYEDNLGEPLRAVREDVEREWIGKVEEERKVREEKEAWAQELIRQLEREKQLRQKLEDEKRALQIFVTDIEQISFRSRTGTQLPRPSMSGATAFAEMRRRSNTVGNATGLSDATNTNSPSPFKMDGSKLKPSLLDQRLEEIDEAGESSPVPSRFLPVLGDKENLAL